MASHSQVSSINQASSLSQAPIEKPSAPPVNILPSKLAQVYSYAHPILLLAICAARFEALVANPVQELLADLPWLALLQLFYVILCLPPAASPAADSSSASDAKATRSRSGKPGYRRKNSGKNVWAAVWAKLMVYAPIVYS
jgi:phosphatidylinositol glycan class F